MNGKLINDRYRLDEEIGLGGMGVVYRAYDDILKREVAVKVLSDTGLGTQGRTRLLEEAQAAAGLKHPNIVAVHDAGEVDGSPFIVMELVDGAALNERLPDSLEEILAVTRQMCAALDHAHSNGVIHRDLKPENVLVEHDGRIKLVDFGLARSASSRLTSETSLAGTASYMAPELAMGVDYDERADLYALGVMLYELTTGEPPFTADTLVGLITQHLRAPVVPPRARNDKVPPAVDALIVQMLSKDPDDRPASAAQVLEILEQPGFLEVGSSRAEEIPALERVARGRMVGRISEYEQARALWEKAMAGEGQLLLVSGEPGIGKTRLTSEMATHAEVSSGQALVGASYAEGSAPYAAFAQIIRQALPGSTGNGLELPDSTLADLLTLTPELRRHYPEVPENPPMDPQAEQQRLFENFIIFFSALSERHPLMLVLEDSHWADSGTLSLLRHLARHTRQQRLMILSTYREVELDEALPFHEVLVDLRRERLGTRMKLTRLNRIQTREMLASLFAEEITPEFLAGIFNETEGNPFFIEEVCKALVESGKLYYRDGSWHRPSMEELGIPQSVRVTIQSRVSKLPESTQEMLRQAAVLGREFDFDTLVLASQLDEDTLVDALEDAEHSQMIKDISTGQEDVFAFTHALIPTTLVEGLRRLQRRRLNRRAAAAVESSHPEDFESLAHHYGEAGDDEQALAYHLLAGDRARGLYAYQEAIDNYQQALEILQETDAHVRAARTLMKLAQAYHSALQFERVQPAYEQAFAMWQRVAKVPPADLPPAPHALRTYWIEPTSLDPTIINVGPYQILISQIFSGLVEHSPELDIVPALARSWEVSADGSQYTFHLQGNLRWSDGKPLTAADFEFAWKRTLDPTLGSLNAELLYDLKGARAYHQGQEIDPECVGVRALDERTLAVELEGPTGYFLQLLAHIATFPIPQHVVAAHGEAWTEVSKIVGNGPFQLESWAPGESMVFGRNPHYHGRFDGNLQEVALSLFAFEEKPNLLDLYASDRVDIFTLGEMIPEREIEMALKQYRGEVHGVTALWTTYFTFDTTCPPFDDLRVRQAFALATDKNRLAGQSLSIPATGGLLPPTMPGHSAGIALPYDPEQARQLLAEAGYPGGRGFPDVKTIAPMTAELRLKNLRRQWRDILGVDIIWELLDADELYGDLSGRAFHLSSGGWAADYLDPDSFLRVGVNSHQGGWQNETYAGLVEGARRMSDQEARMKMYRAADKILIEEVALLPMFYPTSPIEQSSPFDRQRRISGTAGGDSSLHYVCEL